MRSVRASNPAIGEFIFLNRTRYDLTAEVIILGCTLWTHVPAAATEAIGRGLNDFLQVNDWTLEKHIAAHAQDVQWLEQQCAEIRTKEPGRRIIILTHHAPTFEGTIAPERRDSPIASGFATEMTKSSCWGSPVVAWGFGHTHFNCDFMLGGVRVVCNQRGYEGLQAKRSRFSPEKILLI
jgi:hypothetical protein